MNDESEKDVKISVRDRLNMFENNKEFLIKPSFNRDMKSSTSPSEKETPTPATRRIPKVDSFKNHQSFDNNKLTQENDKSESSNFHEREKHPNKNLLNRSLPAPPPLARPPPKKSEIVAQEKALPPIQETKYPINSLKDQKSQPHLVNFPIKQMEKSNQNIELCADNETQIQFEEPKYIVPPTRLMSPIGNKVIHPPLPPPPPSSKLLELSKHSKSIEATMPPLPPPPSGKTPKKTNILVGWVKSQNSETTVDAKNLTPPLPPENRNKPTETIKPQLTIGVTVPNQIDNKTKNVEPPPVVAPPPSLLVVQKIREREVSPSSSTENPNSVRSSVQSSNINEEQYDEDNSLSGEPWFFDVTRDEASKLMKSSSKKGSYLMRPSENNQYVLMVRFESNEVKKFKIQMHNDGWILGDPSKAKKIHPDLISLINYYITNGVKFGNLIMQLKEPVKKK